MIKEQSITQQDQLLNNSLCASEVWSSLDQITLNRKFGVPDKLKMNTLEMLMDSKEGFPELRSFEAIDLIHERMRNKTIDGLAKH